ncbi:MAG: sigma-54-dependent transcriptional regulator [Myxococcales bacterium]|jgi:two-component system response regulator AtoC
MRFQHILLVDDDSSMRHVLAVILTESGYEVRAVSNGEEALAELEKHDYDLVLSDVRMPKMDGLTLLKEIRERRPELTVVVMSAYGTHDSAIEAVKAGAYDYINKPFKPDEVVLVLRKAEERERLKRENERLRSELSRDLTIKNLIGTSEQMQEVVRQVRKLAPVKSTALITGESGTGKELIARALHELSPRAAMPFVAVNCGALPEQLMESELFGHAKGAFTDAVRSKKGLFTEADGGTLLLDEVGELPAALQVKLLRVLQEEEIRPVGDTRSQKIDVRVVAATRRDLAKEVAEGRFREDLYYRLNVVNVRLPPLRERPSDIPNLAWHFVAKYNERLGRKPPITSISAAAMDVLLAHSWPGNVRELENAIERAMVLCEGETITPEGLRQISPRPSPTSVAPDALVIGPEELSIKRATTLIEAELIRRALRKTGGNRTRAAELLELSQRALIYKIKDYGIDADNP